MSNSESTALAGVGQVAINVKDPARALAFYRDVLGLRLLFQAGQLSFFDCGGLRLMLDRPEKQEFDHPSSILYFKVGDIKAAHQRLRAADVNFIDEPHLVAKMSDHELWMTFFHDSEENVLALMAEIKVG